MLLTDDNLPAGQAGLPEDLEGKSTVIQKVFFVLEYVY
jgi:hypothetical protein